jgi:type VI secretion system protein ImpM
MSDLEATPGWYGKLPTLGDFASRRLPADFIEPWDLWLANGLAAQRDLLGEGWLDAYLASPVWRFGLMPGALGPKEPAHPTVGVLMPSVDRVGRYFPLTLATGLPRLPGSVPELEFLLGWLQRLEDVALDALQDDWAIDDLERVLEQLPPPLDASLAAPEHLWGPRGALVQAIETNGSFIAIDAVRNRSELASMLAGALTQLGAGALQQVVAGASFWLADHPEQPRLLVSRGLPGRDEFVQMLGASGRESDAATIF